MVADVAKLPAGREDYYTRGLATDHEQYAGPWRLLRPRCTATLRGEGYAPARTGAASLATRSGSATASIWTILPAAMVKENTA